MCYQAIEDLLGYALRTGLIEECDRTWAANRLLQTLGLESWEPPQTVRERPLEDILRELLDDAGRHTERHHQPRPVRYRADGHTDAPPRSGHQ